MVLNIFTSQYFRPSGVTVQTDYDCFILYPSSSTHLLPSSFWHFRLQIKIRVMPWAEVRFTIAGCNVLGKKIWVAQRTTFGGWVGHLCLYRVVGQSKNILDRTLIWSEKFSGAHIYRLKKKSPVFHSNICLAIHFIGCIFWPGNCFSKALQDSLWVLITMKCVHSYLQLGIMHIGLFS